MQMFLIWNDDPGSGREKGGSAVLKNRTQLPR